MVNGMHVNKDGTTNTRPRFPPESRREKNYIKYNDSTRACNKAEDEYTGASDRHTAEFEKIADEEKKDYFSHMTASLLPRQHEDLTYRAERWDEHAYQ